MIPACEACRSLKMRCTRSEVAEGSDSTETPCDRCKRRNRPCKVPATRVGGRKPGAVGRYRGVGKALRNIQTELRKAKASSSDLSNVQCLLDLVGGKEEILDLLLSSNGSHAQTAEPHDAIRENIAQPELQSVGPSFDAEPLAQDATISPASSDDGSPYQSDEPVSNPLGLMADACEQAHALSQHSNTTLPSRASHAEPARLLATSPQDIEGRGVARQLLRRPGYVSLGLKLNRESLEHGLDALLTQKGQISQYSDYFKPSNITQDRDTGPYLDPIDLGFVSMEEAHYLFNIFFARLHPINGILDPLLHTPEFVRSRSALLFTWMLAISAQFDLASASVSKGLLEHGERLSRYVHANGYKSVEIAQGYYISLLYAVPANTMAEERSWLYTIYAFGVAAELGLDRQSRGPGYLHNTNAATESIFSSFQPHQSITGVSIPGPGQSHSDSPSYAERLARNRQRTWLRILLWERAHSAARGRVSAFPETELTLNIETWHLHPLADPNDRYTCAFILLRRHLAALHGVLKTQLRLRHASRHWVRELFDSTLQPWCHTWLRSPDAPLSPSERTSNTFLRHVYLHGRLWTLSFALHGQTDEAQHVDTIREDCFEAAVNCCETAVSDLQEIGEPIYCMLAPTWAMISYAAVLALKLFPLAYGDRPGSEVELLALLSQVALQLERAGTTPSHRFGIAALLGQHLFMILRTRANALKRTTEANETQRSVASDALFEGEMDQLSQQPESQSFDPFISTFDPFLTVPFLPGVDDGLAEGFKEGLWDWFGQGVSGVS